MDNDLISRSAIMKKTRAIFSGLSFEHEDEAKSIIETIEALIDVAPAVDAESVRHGKCDLCGRGKPIKAYTYLPDCGLQYGIAIEAIYCPNCGEKMDGGTHNA